MSVKPYGSWDSPITADLITKGAKRFGEIVIDGETIYWSEQRPEEKGRSVIVTEKGDVTPPGYSVRTRVYEYGGGAFTVKNGVVYFVNDKDERVYIQKGSEVKPLTESGTRFADLVVTEKGLIAVAEQGNDSFIALINIENGTFSKLASGHDFYSFPAISPDGKNLAYLTWDLPHMPWDSTEVYLDGQKIAGGDGISIFQPQWSPDGVLHYISDKTGWWNLYRYQNGKEENLTPLSAEFGLPRWVFGMSTYAFLSENEILCTYFENGKWSLALLINGKLKNYNLPVTFFTQIRRDAFIQGSPTQPLSVVNLDGEVLAVSQKVDLDPGYFSIAQSITFPSAKGRTAYGYYYPPQNKDFIAPQNELPPLIVKSHGGPIGATSSVFNLSIQYWTSRGFAVLDVNYGGSTGYGRAYREQLKGKWGILDVEDCEHGAKYLVDKKLVDPKRLIITGGSAGGYTTLSALTFGHTFAAGASYFGISDLDAMRKETHKFESEDLNNLVGKYPEEAQRYFDRSPINFPDKLHCPVIFFQGSEDKVVLPSQAEKMYEALKKKGIETKLIVYQGEQHGFRNADTIKNSLEEELSFYKHVFHI